ncbi:MAG: asparagine synthase-related protein [Gaiellaceae bacterium]
MGMSLGGPGEAVPLPEGPVPSPHEALRAALLPALADPPCLVAFSGGRDSAVLLAVAADVARREGLAPPVPATIRFPAHPETQEDEWQELVVVHLGLADRLVVDLEDELDLLGPLATDFLRRHGPREPATAVFPLPLLQAAIGRGCLVFGHGGDDLLSPWRGAHLADVRAQRTRPSFQTVRQSALAAAPRPLARAVLARRAPILPWLTSRGQRAARRAWADETAEPIRFDKHVRRAAARPALRRSERTLRIVVGEAGASVYVPFLDPLVVEALARAGGATGFGGRSSATAVLAGGTLPPAVLERRGKASFNTAYWGAATRRFAERWSGGGIDPELVDADELRAAWLADVPDQRSALLLQLAWCHEELAPRD